MSIIEKIKELCKHNDTTITGLETDLNFSRGSLVKGSKDVLPSDRIQKIANYFGVTPTYLITDMVYCICPVCGVAYNPLDDTTMDSHKILHNNFITLRDRIGYLLNPSQAATKRDVAKNHLEQSDIPDEGKVFHYETLVQCDFAEHAYFNNFMVDMIYSDFIKDEIRERKYFDLIPASVIKNLTVKYNVELNNDDTPLIDLFQQDKEFMTNITDLWDLPRELRLDVYKSIRHAKRDYADREYFTNPYANRS